MVQQREKPSNQTALSYWNCGNKWSNHQTSPHPKNSKSTTRHKSSMPPPCKLLMRLSQPLAPNPHLPLGLVFLRGSPSVAQVTTRVMFLYLSAPAKTVPRSVMPCPNQLPKTPPSAPKQSMPTLAPVKTSARPSTKCIKHFHFKSR